MEGTINMQHDYHRSQINDVLDAGPLADEDFFRVKVYGKRDSKFLNITRDQLLNLADAMDETNPPSLLPLKNGSRVLLADVRIDWVTGLAAIGTGYVLARTAEDEFVTWRVYLHKGECRWLAEAGEYRSTFEKALVSYNERRGVTVVES